MGKTPLLDVNIDDVLLGLSGLTVRPSTLQPGEWGTATAKDAYTITRADQIAGSVYNTAVARGTAPSGREVQDDDDHKVTVPKPPCIGDDCDPDEGCLTPPCRRLPETGLGTSGFALTALLSLALGGVLLGVAGSGNLQTAMANNTVNADSPMLAMLRRWNLAPKPGGSQARRRRRR
ncbi:MAG TPA: hypothetical protein VGR26_08075 [Acidimicrobiales bacterium]|nr:hypothetical protein [Acidimicrobiales bacterium]